MGDWGGVLSWIDPFFPPFSFLGEGGKYVVSDVLYFIPLD